MSTDLDGERVPPTIDSNLKKGRPAAGEPDAAHVYKQLVERVKALEESLKKMGNEEGGNDAECGAAGLDNRGGNVVSAGAPCLRPIYSTTAEKMGNNGEPPCYTFQMPMHYPRYRKADYETMPEWRLHRLLEEYGLPVNVASTLAEKREYAMGVFLWSNQHDD